MSAVEETMQVDAHRAFSPQRMWALATNTFLQLTRMKVFYFLLAFSLAIFVIAMVASRLTPEEELKFLKNAALGGMSLFSMLLAIAATALLLPRDVEDRTLYTILAKPVPRHEYLFGKWLGVVLMLFTCLLVMDLVMSAAIYWRQSQILDQQVATVVAKAGAAEAASATAQLKTIIEAQGVTWNVHLGVVAIFLEAAIMAALALLISTFATSTIFTIMISVGFWIIGEMQSLARSFLFAGKFTEVTEKVISLGAALIFPDFSQFTDVANAAGSGLAIPLGMVLQLGGIACMYWLMYGVASFLVFSEKEL